MKEAAVKISRFSFSYGPKGKEILADIDLSVAQGEYVSIIGPNGAGKSTLLKCLNRIIRGGRGSIEVFGKNVQGYTQKELGRLIGYVSQTREQAFPYTVFEFVLMARYPYLSPLSRVSKEDTRVVEEALSMTNTTDFASRKVNTLSGGERQKVYLAGALAQQPKILLLDEPTTHLDPRYHAEIQQTISDICTRLGMTILHVTHDFSHIAFWSKKVIAIKGGRVHATGTPDEILTRNRLKDIFDTDFLLIPHPSTRHNIIVVEPKT